MDRSVGKNEIPLIFLKLELPLINLHVKKEELFVCSGNAELILCDSLTSRISSFEDSIIHTERVYLLIQSLYSLHLWARKLDDLHAIRREHCNHIWAWQILYDINLCWASLSSFILWIKSLLEVNKILLRDKLTCLVFRSVIISYGYMYPFSEPMTITQSTFALSSPKITMNVNSWNSVVHNLDDRFVFVDIPLFARRFHLTQII